MSSLRERYERLAAIQKGQNKEIRRWGSTTQVELMRNISRLGIGRTDTLFDRLADERAKYSKAYGDIFRIQFPNTIGGIMTSHGVGGNGNENRVAKDWYGSTMDRKVEILADIIMEHKAEEAQTNVETTLKILK